MGYLLLKNFERTSVLNNAVQPVARVVLLEEIARPGALVVLVYNGISAPPPRLPSPAAFQKY